MLLSGSSRLLSQITVWGPQADVLPPAEKRPRLPYYFLYPSTSAFPCLAFGFPIAHSQTHSRKNCLYSPFKVTYVDDYLVQGEHDGAPHIFKPLWASSSIHLYHQCWTYLPFFCFAGVVIVICFASRFGMQGFFAIIADQFIVMHYWWWRITPAVNHFTNRRVDCRTRSTFLPLVPYTPSRL